MSGSDPGVLLQALRSSEPERYWPLLYVRTDRRDDLAALQAFDAEIASIPSKISEPLPGEIRIQWWRDLISAGGTGDGGGPLAQDLLRVIRTYDLPGSAFDRMLEARIADLYDDPFPDRTSLEAHFGATASTILQLSATVLDRQAANETSEAAGHGGCAIGTVRLLRRLAVDRARGRVGIPLDILGACGLERQSFLDASSGDARLRAVVEAVLALANHHMAAFRANARRLPASVRAAFLPLALVERDLAPLSRDSAGIIHGSRRSAGPLSQQWALLRRASIGWR